MEVLYQTSTDLNEKILSEKEANLKRLSECLAGYCDYMDSDVINPSKLAVYLNVKRKKAKLKNEYGVRGFFSFDTDKNGIIYYDSELEIPELRYTLAHELIHYILSEPYKDKCSSNLILDLIDEKDVEEEPEDEIEKICDQFAMKALMPEAKFREAYYENGYNEKTKIEGVASYFDVEIGLVRRYARQLGLGG